MSTSPELSAWMRQVAGTAAEAISRDMIRGRVSEEVAAGTFTSLIVSSLSASDDTPSVVTPRRGSP